MHRSWPAHGNDKAIRKKSKQEENIKEILHKKNIKLQRKIKKQCYVETTNEMKKYFI